MLKYAFDVKPSNFEQVDKHKTITIRAPGKTFRFIRGRENIIMGDEKVTVLFSDLNKPVKQLRKGRLFQGPKPSELIKDFALEIREYDAPDPEPRFNGGGASAPAVIVKHGIDLPLSAFKKIPPHKVITISKGDKSIQFVRGKDNVILKEDKVLVLFSDLAKPVKVFKDGDLQPGPTPKELIEGFGLIRRTINTSPNGKGHGMNYRLPPVTPELASSQRLFKPVSVPQRIERAVEGLHKLIEVLPQTAPVGEIQSAIMALNKIRTGLVIKAMREAKKDETEVSPKKARPAFSGSVFKAEALSGSHQRRRTSAPKPI